MSNRTDNVILQNLLAFQFAPAATFNQPKINLARQILEHRLDTEELVRVLTQAPNHCWRAAQSELETGAKHGIQHLSIFDAEYPQSLLNIADPPLVISCRGAFTGSKTDQSPRLVTPPRIALVGTRDCSPGARKTAFDWAEELTARGVDVVSGLARGVDCSAHHGALSALKKHPLTSATSGIAVIATGLLEIYPPDHTELAHQIEAAGGVILSEAPLRAKAEKHLFPRRNRIISGLSSVTVVIEAPKRSGAMITARTALEQGREVLVMPGAVGDLRSEGSNSLLRDGARPALTAQDLIDALPPWERKAVSANTTSTDTNPKIKTPKTSTPDLTNTAQNILKHLQTRGEASTEEICETLKTPLPQTLAALTELELQNLLEPCPGSIYRLTPR